MSEYSPFDNKGPVGGRVIVMVDSFPTLSQTFVLDQIEGLISRGVNVRIVAGCRDKSGLIQEKGRSLAAQALYAEDHVPLLKFLPPPIRRLLHPPRPQSRFYSEALHAADLVICHFGPVGRRAALALGNVSGPRLWTIFHGYDLSSYLKRVGINGYATLFERGDRFFGVSRLWMAKLAELGCSQERIGLLRMGIDVDRIPFIERKVDLGRGLRILSVCRLVEKKGIEFALRAVAELERLRPELKWSYEIVGEGPCRRSLEHLSEILGVRARVNFSGRLSAESVRSRLAQSDVFMLPSVTARNGDMEGIPVSLMEAMAAGLPVLSTHHSGIPELVDAGRTGLLSPERDHLNLARNLCKLVDQPVLASSIARAARRKIECEFNQDTISDYLVAEIEKELLRVRIGQKEMPSPP